ncbi:MAG: hypothetical protein ACAI38_25390 [Myxococcota bacterium]
MHRNSVLIAGLLATAMAACGSEEDGGNEVGLNDGQGGCAGITNCLNLDVTTDTRLAAGDWILSPRNDGGYVTVASGVTLEIAPGTTIRGLTGAALIVPRGARIVAEGTEAEPIVFTSAKEEGSRAGGDWGGLLILGNAPVNEPSPHFEALPASDATGDYGGDDVADDSGILRYVRIEFAGFTYATDKEFNALTLCGVGNSTVIDYVQVHRGSDDGVELFGGTADLRHVISSQNQDDGFDTDFGWSGRTQFLVVQHINGQSSDPNGYESDNRPDGQDYNALPRTEPTIFNATLIGSASTPTSSRGAVLRRGTAGIYGNHIFASFKSSAVDVRDSATTQGFGARLAVQSSVFWSNAGGVNWQDESSGSANNDNGFEEAVAFMADALANVAVDPGLPAASTHLTAPSFQPASFLTGLTPPADGFFDTSATFIGGIGADDWTTGWASYPED